MVKKVGVALLRSFALMGCASIIGIFILTAGSAFMPGTKIGHLFGASTEALAGPEETAPARDGGTAPDAGTLAPTPAGQGSTAPAQLQPVPAQQER